MSAYLCIWGGAAEEDGNVGQDFAFLIQHSGLSDRKLPGFQELRLTVCTLNESCQASLNYIRQRAGHAWLIDSIMPCNPMCLPDNFIPALS